MAVAASRVDELINYFKSHNKIREQQSHSAKVHSVGWSCDGKYLASGSFDKSVCIFSLCPDRLVSKHSITGIVTYLNDKVLTCYQFLSTETRNNIQRSRR